MKEKEVYIVYTFNGLESECNIREIYASKKDALNHLKVLLDNDKIDYPEWNDPSYVKVEELDEEFNMVNYFCIYEKEFFDNRYEGYVDCFKVK